ncbi:MAG: hypothetical protein Greene07147_615 [Parcubacteria group bacterium Greene0714_7]|nr:MAG: hypothetical protein Greene07147_615 [Parcubacteria group bacterium Greene0714_7]
MNLKYEIKPENLKVLEIKQITLNKDKFGALTFDKAYPKLHEIRKMLVEFEELGYVDLLTSDEVNEVNSLKSQLLHYVQRVNDLNPETDATFNINVRDSLENEIDNFCKGATKQLRANLVFLRQEAARKSTDQQSLAEEQKAATQARKQTEETLNLLQQKLEKLNEREQQLETTSGKVGAKALAIHFNTETILYQGRADGWFKAVVISYLLLVVLTLGIVAYYTWWHQGGWAALTWQEGTAKLALLAVSWYAVSFFIRSYNVNSHLAAVNRHRTAVAGTLEDFLASNPSATGEMLQNGTDAMFKHAAIGFITKAEKDSGNPLLEIVNKITNPKPD